MPGGGMGGMGGGKGGLVPPMPGGGMMGGAGMMGGGTDGGGMGGGGNDKKDGVLTLGFNDNVLTLKAEVAIPATGDEHPAYSALKAQVERQVVNLKGQADLLSKQPWAHQLAAAVQAYLKEKGEFPQGARSRAALGARPLPYRPDQRLSFYADLLPYLGEEYKGWQFGDDSGWNEGYNLRIAQRIVPHLVGVRQDRAVPAMVSYPGMEAPVAGCCWVGVAGVGLDAASYEDDAATAKKRGAFAYDRSVKKEDVKDGLEQTIVLLMVPPTNSTPWLAGGGSTVRGVADADEDDKPLEPFVCTTFPPNPERKSKFDGKRGTLAIMGDGKVRFIPADMDAKEFRALCTIAGDDKIEKVRLNAIAPVIEDDSERDLRSGGGGGFQAEKPAEKEKPKEVASNNKGKLEGTKWASDEVTVQGLKMPKGAFVVAFEKDGTFVQEVKAPDLPARTAKGTWSLGSGDDVIMEGEDPERKIKAKETVQVVIKGDKATVTSKAGSLTFTKVN